MCAGSKGSADTRSDRRGNTECFGEAASAQLGGMESCKRLIYDARLSARISAQDQKRRLVEAENRYSQALRVRGIVSVACVALSLMLSWQVALAAQRYNMQEGAGAGGRAAVCPPGHPPPMQLLIFHVLCAMPSGDLQYA